MINEIRKEIAELAEEIRLINISVSILQETEGDKSKIQGYYSKEKGIRDRISNLREAEEVFKESFVKGFKESYGERPDGTGIVDDTNCDELAREIFESRYKEEKIDYSEKFKDRYKQLLKELIGELLASAERVGYDKEELKKELLN